MCLLVCNQPSEGGHRIEEISSQSSLDIREKVMAGIQAFGNDQLNPKSRILSSLE